MMSALLATVAAGLCIGDSIQANGGGACNMLPYEMTNIAKNGTTTGYWAKWARLYSWEVLHDSEFDFAIITLGSNDAAYPIAPGQVRDNVGYIAGVLHSYGIEYVFIDIEPHAYGEHEFRNSSIDKYATQYTNVAAFAPFAYLGIDWREYMNERECFPDDLHPSAGCNMFLVDPYVARISQVTGFEPVPEPSTALLVAGGLVGLGFLGRRR